MSNQNSSLRVVALGGTFDHFHAGHQHFLDFAAVAGSELRVGITVEKMTTHKPFADQIQDFDVRKREVEKYLQTQNIRHQIFSLEDAYGPTVENSDIEILAVTEATEKGGIAINKMRAGKKFPPLEVLVCPMLKDETGEWLSSTRIREGRVNRQGVVYEKIFANDVTLNEKQRDFFHHKQGQIVSEPSEKFSNRYVVGDIVLETFIQKKWEYEIGVFDGQNSRQKYDSQFLENLPNISSLENNSGQIRHQLIQKLIDLIDESDDSIDKIGEPAHLEIKGEEDLVAVALALIAPLGSAIYYGQPSEGIVEMIVSEELKAKLWHQFVEENSETDRHI